ncbi:MAG: DUF4433 domain-containing protein [Acidimicrobiia bacterium]|nr:DUF4433 domain-containing protein [Acidimicrobiia bacterium]
MTWLENLESVVLSGGLWSDAQLATRGIAPTNYGDPEIKAKRLRRAVPVVAKGTGPLMLGDFVPFYVLTRNAALYVMQRDGGRGSVPVMLVASAHSFAAETVVWTDRHPLANGVVWTADFAKLPSAFDSAQRLDHSWREHGSGPKAKHEWMAEFLVKDHVPWSAIMALCIRDENDYEAALQEAAWLRIDTPVRRVPDLFESERPTRY